MKKRVLTLWIYVVLGVGLLFLNINIEAISKNVHHMKTNIHIEFNSEGGFAFIPKLHQLAIVDSNALSEEQVKKLQSLIEEANFFELPENNPASSSGAADYQQYMISIEKEGRRHRVNFTDLVDNPALKELFAFLKSIQLNSK
jgi:hypothetical protein